MSSSSKTSIYTAITANVLIAISKFIASIFTGSSAMLSEGIHSLVDTGNGLLLILGIRRSIKKADNKRPFGYGNEIYFWSFVVSILIFALGGGFAILQGIHSIKSPHLPENPYWNYGVLFAALLFEGASLIIALKIFKKSHISGNLISNIIKSKDPAKFAVIIEDSAAVVGIIIALVGIFLSEQLQNPFFDGFATLLIGLLLLGMAFFLARETKGLLMGESASKEILEKIIRIVGSNQNIKDCGFPKTIHFGPRSILVIIEVELMGNLDLDEIEMTMDAIRHKVQEGIPDISNIFIQISNSNLPDNK